MHPFPSFLILFLSLYILSSSSSLFPLFPSSLLPILLSTSYPETQEQFQSNIMHSWENSNQARVKHKQTHHPFYSQTQNPTNLIFPGNRGIPFDEDKMPTPRTQFSPEKWTEKKVGQKVIARRRNASFSSPSSNELDLQDTLFFSSSETEHPVFHNPKSGIPPRPKLDISNDKQALFVKTRSRAQKIYSNLKNLKQPISPGARLTNLLTSLFVKESKTKKTAGTGGAGVGRKECKSEQASTSSTATSFARSCLSRNSSRKRLDEGVKRTVRFSPVGVIVGEDSRACGHKALFNDTGYDCEEERKRLERESEKAKLQQQKQRRLEEMALDLLNGYWDSKLNNNIKSHNQKVNHDDYGVNHPENYDDDDDGLSCSSSDLFELDHLSLIGVGVGVGVGDELPVYETTHFYPKNV